MAAGDLPPTYHAVIKRDLETGAKDRRWRRSRSKDERRLSY